MAPAGRLIVRSAAAEILGSWSPRRLRGRAWDTDEERASKLL